MRSVLCLAFCIRVLCQHTNTQPKQAAATEVKTNMDKLFGSPAPATQEDRKTFQGLLSVCCFLFVRSFVLLDCFFLVGLVGVCACFVLLLFVLFMFSLFGCVANTHFCVQAQHGIVWLVKALVLRSHIKPNTCCSCSIKVNWLCCCGNRENDCLSNENVFVICVCL